MLGMPYRPAPSHQCIARPPLPRMSDNCRPHCAGDGHHCACSLSSKKPYWTQTRRRDGNRKSLVSVAAVTRHDDGNGRLEVRYYRRRWIEPHALQRYRGTWLQLEIRFTAVRPRVWPCPSQQARIPCRPAEYPLDRLHRPLRHRWHRHCQARCRSCCGIPRTAPLLGSVTTPGYLRVWPQNPRP